MNSTAISTKSQLDQIIQGSFNQASDKAKAIEFMTKFFQNFVIKQGKPSNFTLQQCVDAVNTLIAEPVKELLKKTELSDDEIQRIKIWNTAHRDFEVKLQLELTRIGNSMEKSELLFKA